MAKNYISKINVGGNQYDIYDAEAHTAITNINGDISTKISGVQAETGTQITAVGTQISDLTTAVGTQISDLKTALSGVQNKTLNDATITITYGESESLATAGDFTVNQSGNETINIPVKDVALTGSYNDLTNKPSIPSNISDLGGYENLATDTELSESIGGVQGEIGSKITGVQGQIGSLKDAIDAITGTQAAETLEAIQQIKAELEDPTGQQGFQSFLDKAHTVLSGQAKAITSVPSYSFNHSYTDAQTLGEDDQIGTLSLSFTSTGSLADANFIPSNQEQIPGSNTPEPEP